MLRIYGDGRLGLLISLLTWSGFEPKGFYFIVDLLFTIRTVPDLNCATKQRFVNRVDNILVRIITHGGARGVRFACKQVEIIKVN